MTIKINGTNTTAQPSITGADTDTGLVYGTDEVQVVTGGTTRVTVDSSGAATFGGVGTFSGDLRVQDGGNFRVRTAADASSDAILLQNNGNITASGSATFAGDVTVNANLLVKGGNGSGVFIRNQGNTAYTINLNENGSAQFAGSVSIGGTAAANTIDEYEEGTFTPSYSNALGSPSYTSRDGFYVKIGQLVMFSIRILATGTMTGNQLTITGLPFTSKSTAGSEGGAFFNFAGNLFPDSNPGPKLHIGANGTTIFFYRNDGNAWHGATQNGVSGRLLHINGQYLA